MQPTPVPCAAGTDRRLGVRCSKGPVAFMLRNAARAFRLTGINKPPVSRWIIVSDVGSRKNRPKFAPFLLCLNPLRI